MRTKLTMMALCASLCAYGCGDDDGGTDTGTPDGGGGDTGGGDTGGGDTGGGDTGTPDGGGGEGMICQESCTMDEDCTLGMMDLGFTCEAGRCTGEAPMGCEADADCVALFNGWQLGDSDGDFLGDAPCTGIAAADGTCADGESCCFAGNTCLDSGRCAPTAPEGGCADPSVDVMAMDSAGAVVTVCGQPGTDDATCSSGACMNPCAADMDCASPTAPICNTDTGMCGCGEDSHCADVPGLPVCNTDTGQCNCDADSCTGTNQNVCNDNGFCGCDDDAVCTETTFDGTTTACESF